MNLFVCSSSSFLFCSPRGLLDFMSAPSPPRPPPPPPPSAPPCPPSAGPQPRPSTPSVPCRSSTSTIRAQCSLPELNHDHPCPVFPAGLNHDHPRPVFPAGPQPRPSALTNDSDKLSSVSSISSEECFHSVSFVSSEDSTEFLQGRAHPEPESKVGS